MVSHKVFQKLTLGLLLLLSSIATLGVHAKEPSILAYQTTNILKQSNDKKSVEQAIEGNSFYQALVAELYNQTGEPGLTLQYYLPLALRSNDESLVKRVTEIATGSGQLVKGLKISQYWVSLKPKNIEARQYYTLLLLRDNQYKKSAEQLQFVRNIIEGTASNAGINPDKKNALISKGLKFIGALLVIESHHDKAFKVFNHYLEKYGSPVYKDQQNLITASLAMKAKEYEAVVVALEDIENSDTPHFVSAALMKTKALQKLSRFGEATQLLKRLVNSKVSSDSLRLQLTRSLIAIGEKKEASEILHVLIEKHPDNYDLLKSLVAINIDQKNWGEAQSNTNKLYKNKAYKNDANYFYGEIKQAQGKYESALSFFKQVQGGAFLKRAHAKVATLISTLENFENAQHWLQQEQEKSSKKKDKAHWMKLEADLLVKQKEVEPKDIQDALSLYNKIILLLPNKASNYYYRGLLFERANQFSLAEKDLRLVI